MNCQDVHLQLLGMGGALTVPTMHMREGLQWQVRANAQLFLLHAATAARYIKESTNAASKGIRCSRSEQAKRAHSL